jgi:acyl carrier protein
VEETIKKFLSSQLLIEFNGDIDDESDLFELGVIDSYAYVELIRFLEREFDLRFTNEEILSNVVVSVAGMVSLVAHKSQVPG